VQEDQELIHLPSSVP